MPETPIVSARPGFRNADVGRKNGDRHLERVRGTWYSKPVAYALVAAEGRQSMPAQLVALHDGPSILLDKPILLLGRHPECDIQIDSRKISRRHCCIAQVSDYLVVRDLGSTNGVRINGVRVIEGRLAPGDELTIGNHRYRLTWESEAPRQMPPPRNAAAPIPPRPNQKRTLLDSVPDDAALESCDEPVPLPDPGEVHDSLPFAPPRDPTPAKPPAAGEASKILPEHIDLMPSDPFPSPPSHPGT